MKYIILLCVTLLTGNSCSDDGLSMQEQFEVDTKLIEDYLTAKNLTAQKTVDGIYYIINEEGSSEKPTITSQVTVTYKGYFLDGAVFDSGDKAKFKLFEVIEGWQKGIPKFGKGGKGILLIPSKFGYGNRTVSGRSNAVLGFDIEVFDF